MSNSDVLLEERGRASWVVINRPQVHNALAGSTLSGLLQALEEASRAHSAAIVLTGAGGRAFCAGGDLELLARTGSAEARHYLGRFAAVLRAIRGAGKPVIARVEGFCYGGGNELALCSDLIIASEGSSFGQLGPSVGAAAVLATTQLLPRALGERKAREVMLLCHRYSAREALEMGWINRVVPAEALDDAVREWVERIAQLSPQSLRISKLSMNAAADDLGAAMSHGVELLSAAFDTEELKEGMRAFLEKRPPDFDRFR